VPTAYFKDDTGSSYLPPTPIPLYWQSSLSDDWTLNWSPLPISVSHQFSYTKDQVWGTTFGMGGGYASSLGAVLVPTLNFYHRMKVGADWAWETSPSASGEYHTKGDPWEWSVGVWTGPMFQLTETFALSPKVGVKLEN